MKTFEPLALDRAILEHNVNELEALLTSAAHLKERDHLIPFFKERPHLCTAVGYANSAVELPDRWANELDLFGDFVCDFAAGDAIALAMRPPKRKFGAARASRAAAEEQNARKIRITSGTTNFRVSKRADCGNLVGQVYFMNQCSSSV